MSRILYFSELKAMQV